MKVTTSGFVASVVLSQKDKSSWSNRNYVFCNANVINLCTSLLSTKTGRLPK